MSLPEKFIEDFNKLPEEKQREVVDLFEHLKLKEEKEIENLMKQGIKENKKALEELAK